MTTMAATGLTGNGRTLGLLHEAINARLQVGDEIHHLPGGLSFCQMSAHRSLHGLG